MDEKTKKGIDKTVEIRYNNGRARRGVAQFGRVLGLGPRCRRFKSCRLDQKNLVKLLTMDQKPAIINRLSPQYAGVAQLVEQLICNQQVGGSSPSTSSTKLKISYGRVPEWPKGADCKSVVSDFGGPNPPSPTRLSLDAIRVQTLFYCPAFPLAAEVASKTFTPFRLSLDAIRVRALFFCPVVRLAAGAAV